MRSVMVTGPGQITVETVSNPVLAGPGDALVRVGSAAICGSDIHFYDGDIPVAARSRSATSSRGGVEVGSDVRRFRAGDRVLVSSVDRVRRCVGCATGDPYSASTAEGVRLR